MALNLNKTNLKAQAEEGYEFELLLPEVREPTGGFITVRGNMSEAVQAFARKKYRENEIKEEMFKRRNPSKEYPKMTLEEAEEFSIDMAVNRIIGWRGIELEEGVELAFNEENVRKVLKDHAWIRVQVIEQSDDVANFIKN